MDKKKARFSKKILILSMACIIIYAIVYLILCFKTSQLPDYSFNAGIFAALTAENGFNAWIKTSESSSSIDEDLVTSDTPVQEEP